MRDSNFDSQSFILELERIAKSACSGKFLTRSALDNSNPQWRLFQNDFIITDRSLQNLIVLSILSWFMAEEDRILVQDSLQRHRQSDLVILEFLLESKGSCELWLVENTMFHTRDFFGNIYNEKTINRAFRSLRPRWAYVNRPVTRTIRRRGYKDKGTWRLPSEQHGIPTFVITEEEERERRKTYSDTVQLLRGFLGSG